MATSDFSALPTADELASRLDDFRATIKDAIVQVVTGLGEEADASDFDLRFLPLTLTESDLEITSLTLNDDDSDPLTLSFSDDSDVELDELSTDDLVSLYQVVRDSAAATRDEYDD
ncbi:hypothetical protein GCM10028803_49210 [Larkinella knui]|uniref:Uncharacterized protein n=1 Tax=Larkinella knui TaxID=2025310 RepID=A0A3P1CQ92_9BACT|nr:hypothetical protein [Larkinella knui]RRB15492.1 hypothetical protein EHT87_13280 [Larkinella knui]